MAHNRPVRTEADYMEQEGAARRHFVVAEGVEENALVGDGEDLAEVVKAWHLPPGDDAARNGG